MNHSNMLRKGTILRGVYRIEKPLSSGGFGNTYVATNTEFEEQVAIKEFFMKGDCHRQEYQTTVSVSNTEKSTQFEEQKEKFKKEARRLRKLRNSHIIGVHDLFEENGTAYYVMDFINGESLDERMKRTGKALTEQEVRQILPQLLDALQTVHEAGLWHLDLKPANVMMDKAGMVKLIDFGASKQLNAQDGGATASTAITYTNGYAPREQMEQNYEKFGPWTDIYSLGATLYALLTNRRPPLPSDLDDDDSSDKHEALPFPAGVSKEMRSIILQMMKTNRLKRPQDISQVMSLLEAATVADEPVGSKEAEAPQSVPDEEETIIAGQAAAPQAQDDEETILSAVAQDEDEEEEEDDNDSETVSVEEYEEQGNGKKYAILAVSLTVLVICGLAYFTHISSSEESEDSVEYSAGSSGYGTIDVSYSWGKGVYTGDLKNGEPHGHGTIEYEDGSKFVGEFKEGKTDGSGTYTAADGTVLFEGTYKDGIRHQGTARYSNGRTYTGSFGGYAGSPHGEGTLKSANGEVLFKGEFYYGNPWTGYGKESDSEHTYEGYYKDGRFHGKGTYVWLKAKKGYSYKYVGEYVNGGRTGQGTMYYTGGDFYEGSFKNGDFEGKGTYYDADDHTYVTGIWKNDKLVKQTEEGTWE